MFAFLAETDKFLLVQAVVVVVLAQFNPKKPRKVKDDMLSGSLF